MKLIPFQNNQLIIRNNNLVNRLFSPKLTGESVLKEMINISNQLKINLKQNNSQLTKFYCGEDFQKLLNNQVKQNRNTINQTLSAYSSPGIIIYKQSVSPMEQYLTFNDFKTYKQLPQQNRLIQCLTKINCKLEQSPQLYQPSSNYHNLKSIMQGKQNLNHVFNQVVEILQPHSIVDSVNTGHGLNEELFDLNGNIFSITLDENNIYPEKRKETGKYYWPQIDLLFSWSINLENHKIKNPLLAHTFLEDSQFIKDIFYQNRLN